MLGYGGGGMSCNGGYNFTTLIALILIVLVFGNKSYGRKGGSVDGHDGGYTGGLDKSILFIIAFFFLACGCGSCGRGVGFGGAY